MRFEKSPTTGRPRSSSTRAPRTLWPLPTIATSSTAATSSTRASRPTSRVRRCWRPATSSTKPRNADLQMEYPMQKLISADDHLVEPASLWQNRLPAKYRAEGPRLVDTDQGSVWLIGDRRYSLPRKNEFVSGRTDAKHFGADEHSFKQSELLLPFYDSAARADLMKSDGIVGSLCFPTLPRFSGTLFLEVPDKDLASQCVSCWNDFL